MKSAVFKRIFSLLLVGVTIASLWSCAEKKRDWLAYRKEPISARLEGNRNGQDFSCEVICTNGRLTALCYISPTTLEGIRISPTSEGNYCVQQRGLSYELSEASLSGGLLLPAELLLLRDAELLSVQRMPNGMLLTVTAPCVEGTVTITLTDAGAPLVITSPTVSLRVFSIA